MSEKTRESATVKPDGKSANHADERIISHSECQTTEQDIQITQAAKNQPQAGKLTPHLLLKLQTLQGNQNTLRYLAKNTQVSTASTDSVLLKPNEKTPAQPSENTDPKAAAANIDRSKVKEKTQKYVQDRNFLVDRHKGQEQQAQKAATRLHNMADQSSPTTGFTPSPSIKQPSDNKLGQNALDSAQKAASVAEQANSLSSAIQLPTAPPPVNMTPPLPAVDATGEPLPPNPVMDSTITKLLQGAQSIRHGGQQLQETATKYQGGAQEVQGQIAQAKQMTVQAKAGISQVSDHQSARRSIVKQAESALQVSEQKAVMVAEQAPQFTEKAANGQSKSNPIASGATKLSSENAAHTPDDPEAAGNSREQGQKLNKVGSDANQINDTIAETKNKATTLSTEAAQAKETNSTTRAKLDGITQKLDATDKHLSGLQQQNVQAEEQIQGLVQKPNTVLASADKLKAQGQAAIDASMKIEERVQKVQQDYFTALSVLPPRSMNKADGHEIPIQRAVLETNERGRNQVNLGSALPEWALSHSSEGAGASQERQKARQRAEQLRQTQLAEIAQAANGDFNKLSAGDKAGLALKLTLENLTSSVSNVNLVDVGKTLLQGLVDPRVALDGVVSGLSMMATGGANLLSGEQWKKDPLGNLLKSSADIATGLTIVLGSITALAVVITGLMAALEVLTLGAATPIAAPIIAFCATVIATTGPWTITVGEVALVLQGLVLIKNLIDAATASTAKQLQGHSEEMAEDVGNAANVAVQMVGAKMASAHVEAPETVEVPGEIEPPMEVDIPPESGEPVAPDTVAEPEGQSVAPSEATSEPQGETAVLGTEPPQKLVWDNIEPQGAEVIPGTEIPKQFTLKTDAGEVFVTGSATKHLPEYLQSRLVKQPGYALNLNSQVLLTSLEASINRATVTGIKFGVKMIEGDWELIFQPGRGGPLPVLIHAQPVRF